MPAAGRPGRRPRRFDPADCSAKLKAMADPTRLAVLRRLLDGPRNVTQLCGLLGVDQSLLSHHLRVLRDAELVVGEREGKAVRYRIAPGVGLDDEERAIDLKCCRLSFDVGG